MASPEQAALDAYRNDINTKWGEVQLTGDDGSWGRDSYLVDTNKRIKADGPKLDELLRLMAPRRSLIDGQVYDLGVFLQEINRQLAELLARSA